MRVGFWTALYSVGVAVLLLPESLAQDVPRKTTPSAAVPNDVERPLVFPNLSDAEIYERVISYMNNLVSLAADFKQEAPFGEVATGRLHLSRPGFAKFSYDQPSPQTIVARDGCLYVRDADLETTDAYPVKETPLKFLLGHRIDPAQAELTKIDRTFNSIIVTLTPKKEEAEGQIVFVFAAPDLLLAKWAIIDARGQATLVTLSEIEENKTLPHKIFSLPELQPCTL